MTITEMPRRFEVDLTEPGLPSFNEVLRAALRRRRVSQEELARRTGLSSSGISQILRGKIVPTLETVIKIEVALELPRGSLAEKLGYTISLEAGELTPEEMFIEALNRLRLTDTERRVFTDMLQNVMDLHEAMGIDPPPARPES